MTDKTYSKLPGQRFLVIGSRPSLWLAADHLLALERTVGSERYRRFYLRDIEALIIRRTNRRAVLNAVLGGLALVYGIPMAMAAAANTPDFNGLQSNAVTIGHFIGLIAVYLIPSWLLLVLMLVNSLRGPTCETRIRTAVQIEPLPSISRVRVAQKVLLRLRPLIEQTQGALRLEDIAAADWSLEPPGQIRTSIPEPVPREGPIRPVEHDSGRMHVALFVTFVVLAALSLWDASAESTLATLLGLTASLPALVLMIMALRRQARADLPAAARRLTWATLGYFCAVIFVAMAFTMAYAFQNAGRQPVDPMFFRNEPGYAQVQVALGIAALLIGIGGLLSLSFGRRRAPIAEPPTMPDSPVPPSVS